MQATNIWGSVKEKVVEGKESAAEKVTLLKEATVEKVNSVKENVGDAITFESESPVRQRVMLFLMHQLTILTTMTNLMTFSAILMVIMMTALQEATWLGLGSSSKGELDESQVLCKLDFCWYRWQLAMINMAR